MVGAAELLIEGIAKDQNNSRVPNPHKPLLSTFDISETVQSVEVFAAAGIQGQSVAFGER